MRTVARLFAGSLLMSGLAVLPGSPALAAGATTVPLPVDRAQALVLDEAHGRLFLSTGHDRDAVLVTDLAGAQVRRLDGLAGADGLLLDGGTLYVALHGAGAIAAIDTGSLTESRRWSLPADVCPEELALTAGRLVFTATNCGTDVYQGHVGTLDRGSGAVTLVQHGARTGLVIAANEASDGLVALAETYGSPSGVFVYDVRGPEPVLVRASQEWQDVDDLAMAPDGLPELDDWARLRIETTLTPRDAAWYAPPGRRHPALTQPHAL